uniref:Mediator of RNA polymerase II transcription subunit 15-like n=1 Tax=Globodera pallida TaxID=36090 RepID=A0A183BT12_GLOPA
MDQTTEQQNVMQLQPQQQQQQPFVALQQQPYQVQQSHNQQPQMPQVQMLPEQQQRLQEQQVHELPTAQQTVATQKLMAQAAEQQQHHLIQQSQQPVASLQQQIHQLHHSQAFHELVKQKQQELFILQQKKDRLTRWPMPPFVGGILESSANNSIQQPVDKGKQHLAKVGAVGQLSTPISASSFALPGISDQLLPVNLAVNEAGTSTKIQNNHQMLV